MSSRNILVSNSSFVQNSYVQKMKKSNKHYDFVEIDWKAKNAESLMLTELKMGTLLSNKKFLVIRNFNFSNKEIIECLNTTKNSFIILLNKAISSTQEKQLEKEIKNLKVNKMTYDTESDQRKLLEEFASSLFNTIDSSIISLIIRKFKEEGIDKMIQEIRTLSLLNKDITKSIFNNYYKDQDVEDVYLLLTKILNKKASEIIQSFRNLKNDKSDKLDHLYYALSKTINDVVRMRKYEIDGHSPTAMNSETYYSRKYFSIISKRNNIDMELNKLSKILYSIEEDKKHFGIKLSFDYFEAKLLSYCLMESS